MTQAINTETEVTATTNLTAVENDNNRTLVE